MFVHFGSHIVFSIRGWLPRSWSRFVECEESKVCCNMTTETSEQEMRGVVFGCFWCLILFDCDLGRAFLALGFVNC